MMSRASSTNTKSVLEIARASDPVREVIARALCAAVHPARCATPEYWDFSIRPDDKAAFYREADAILSSLREGGWAVVPKPDPTVKMLEAGIRQFPEFDPRCSQKEFDRQLSIAAAIYRAMIARSEG